MHAFELAATIDSNGKVSAQLPVNIDASHARVILLVDDASSSARPKTSQINLQPDFDAVRLTTQNYRFSRDRDHVE